MDTLGEYELPYFRDVGDADAWFGRRCPPRFRIALRIPQDDVEEALRWAWCLRPVTVVVDEKGMSCVMPLHVRDLPVFDYREALRPSTRLGPPEEEEYEEEG